MKKFLKLAAVFILTVVISLFCISVAGCAQTNSQQTSSDSTENFSLIMFDYSLIEDGIFNDSVCYLEYDDPDAFDLEAMADRAGLKEWPTDYLVVTISENLVDEFLEDWNRYEYLGSSKEEWEEKFQLSYKYALKEYYVGNVPNFKIVKVNKDWFSEEPVIVEE